MRFRMLSVLSSVQARPPCNILPKELDILVNDASSQMPTHTFAVYSRRADMGSCRRVTLFPVHNIIFSAQCANLPKLTSPKPAASLDVTESQTTTIPDVIESRTTTISVVPLSIPSPQKFPQLSAYLYTHSANDLLVSLLPPCTLTAHTPPSVEETDLLTLQQHARRMAETYTALLAQAMTINGFRRNACALGIFNLGLWDCMDVAWEVVITDLAIATGREGIEEDGTRTAAQVGVYGP